jgi:uncharacterized protein (DUF2141 family)
VSGAILAAALLGSAATAAATDVQVRVLGVASSAGTVRVAVCARVEFLKPTCRYRGHAPAVSGTTVVTVRGVPPGIYAVQAHHDANDDGRINRDFWGLPTEGIGFSRGAPMRFGPPRFADAAVSVAGPLVALDIPLKFER